MTRSLYSAPDESRRSFFVASARALFAPLAWAVVAAVTAVVSGMCLRRFSLDAPWRVALALAPVLPSLLYVRAFARWIRALDEMQRLIQLQAFGFTFPATVLTAMAVSLLQKGGMLAGWRWDWEGIFFVMLGWYFVGWLVAWRRLA